MIHFDMSFQELQRKLKHNLTPEQGFAYNKKTVARYKQGHIDAQQFNTEPVTVVFSDNINLLRERYPLIPPSTSPKINNPNNYFLISEFKIGIQDFFPRKK
jgi:hypothetical protein